MKVFVVQLLLFLSICSVNYGQDECSSDEECEKYCKSQPPPNLDTVYSGGKCIEDDLGKTCSCEMVQRCVPRTGWCKEFCDSQNGNYDAVCKEDGKCSCQYLCTAEACKSHCKENIKEYDARFGFCVTNSSCVCQSHCSYEGNHENCKSHCQTTGFTRGACRGINLDSEMCKCA